MDGRVAKYHRQMAEVLGVMAQRSNTIRQLLLARWFLKEINVALDPRDTQTFMIGAR